jgi:hypothetical protein
MNTDREGKRMKRSYPVDIWFRWLPGRALTGIFAFGSFGAFFYLLVTFPRWVALTAGIGILALGAWALYAVLDRLDADGSHGPSGDH